jgi:uncharacterized protein with GYD domain|tara:strand:- start:1626 stop:2756 length:1131 start_codon:yes stop_codon:yes gene_type:complete
MAKTTIGKLSAILSLNTAQFSKGMRSAGKQFKAFRKSVNAAGVRVVKFGAALGAAAVAGAALLVRQSFKAIDSLGKMSDALNISTEQLAALRHAAKITGTESSQLDKGLQFLNKTLGEVSTGISTEATKALEEMGLRAEDLIKLDTGQAFTEVADKISKMDNSFERAAISQRVFGRGGKELINLLMTGREGIAAFGDEADRLGITVSRVEANQIEGANDAITRLAATFQGIANQVAIVVAPAIEMIAEKFTNTVGSAGNLRETIVGIMKKIAKAIAVVIVVVDRLARGFKVIGSFLGIFTNLLGIDAAVTGEKYDASKGFKRFGSAVSSAADANAPTVESLTEGIDDLFDQSIPRSGVAGSISDTAVSGSARVLTN